MPLSRCYWALHVELTTNMNEVLQKCVQLWVNYSTGFFKESDRGNIIIGSAILDEWLKKMIITIHRDKLKVIEKFIEYTGPMCSFGSRIDYLFLCGHIDKNTHWALNKLRELRNDMAHKSDHLTFESQPVKDKVAAIAREIGSDKESESAKLYFHEIITRLFFSMSYSFFESIDISREEVIAKWEPIRNSIIKKP